MLEKKNQKDEILIRMRTKQGPLELFSPVGLWLEHQKNQFQPTKKRIFGCGALFDRALKKKQEHL